MPTVQPPDRGSGCSDFEEEVSIQHPEEEIAVQSQQELAVQPTEEKVAVNTLLQPLEE